MASGSRYDPVGRGWPLEEVRSQPRTVLIMEENAGGTMSMGRPKGSKNHQPDYVPAPLPRCQRCGSTRRTNYSRRIIIKASDGVDEDGDTFFRCVRRRTRCLDCGQERDEQSREYRSR